MQKQFFGKETWTWLAIGFLAYVLAPLAWWQPVIAWILLFAAGLAAAIVTSRNVVTGLGLVLFELAIGGQGLLIHTSVAGQGLSLRHMLFLGFFVGYVWQLLRGYEVLKPFFESRIVAPLIALVAWFAVAFVYGGISNGWGPSFDEFNSYFYLAFLVPILGHNWTPTDKRNVLVAITAGIAFLAGSTLLFAFAYGHFSGKLMHIPYVIYRDGRVQEITLQVIQNPPAGLVQEFMKPWLGIYPYWYRVFNPSHVLLLLPLCLYASFAFLHGIDRSIRKHWFWIVTLFASGLLVSMSRSILLGFFGTLVVGLLLAIALKKVPSVSKFGMVTGVGLGVIVMASVIFVAIASLPMPPRPDLRDAAFYATSATTTRETAITSRWTLLSEMHKEILEQPVFGYGFGKSLTYLTSDPRTIEQYGENYTTYRFEWGYQDFLLKFGLLGLSLYAFFIWKLTARALCNLRRESWLNWGILMALLGLGITNVFTPYLNHPLGLAFILVAAIFIDQHEKAPATSEIKEGNVLITFPSGAPAIVAQQERV